MSAPSLSIPRAASLVALIAPWAVACVATSPVAQVQKARGEPFMMTTPSNGRAVVYVYRPLKFKGSGVVMKLSTAADPGMECPLRNGGYRAYIVQPGPFAIEALNGKGDRIEIQAEAGNPKYVRLNPKVGWKINPELEEVDAEEGSQEIGDTKANPECTPA